MIYKTLGCPSPWCLSDLRLDLIYTTLGCPSPCSGPNYWYTAELLAGSRACCKAFPHHIVWRSGVVYAVGSWSKHGGCSRSGWSLGCKGDPGLHGERHGHYSQILVWSEAVGGTVRGQDRALSCVHPRPCTVELYVAFALLGWCKSLLI